VKRILYGHHRDAYDAGNRFGLPEEIEIPNSIQASWNALGQHLPDGKNRLTQMMA
jgi:hypothetical protein